MICISKMVRHPYRKQDNILKTDLPIQRLFPDFQRWSTEPRNNTALTINLNKKNSPSLNNAPFSQIPGSGFYTDWEMVYLVVQRQDWGN